MRLFGWLSLCLLVTATGARAAYADAVPQTRGSAVIVSSHISDRQDAIGAGVIVAIGSNSLRVVTAKHVADAGDVTVWIDRTPYPAEIVRTFWHRDLAVVDALIPHRRLATLARANVGRVASAGEPLTIWGEDDAGPRLERGTLVAPRAPYGDPQGAPLLGFACAGCRQGDSGGGVFNEDGRLLGVLTARIYAQDNKTLMLVAEPIDPSVYATAADRSETPERHPTSQAPQRRADSISDVRRSAW